MPKISIVSACYLNELNIPVFAKSIIGFEKMFPPDVAFEYILIDNGSKDNTWAELEKFHYQYPDKVKLIKLVRNFGETNAVYASLAYATGDCNVMMTPDLMDPPEIILKMYEYWLKGFKLVLANKSTLDESLLQKFISNTGRAIMRKWALKKMPKDGFGLNLFDKEVRETILKIEDKNSIFSHMLIWLGYEYVNIPYTRQKNEKAAYNISKQIKTVIDAFAAFSYFPIRIISISGLILGVLAFLFGIYIIFGRIFGDVAITGWTTIMVVMLFVSSFQMIALGIIGEYVWRGLDASRNRPNFLVDKHS